MKKDPLMYVRHILDAVAHIEQYISGKSKEAILEDVLIQDALIRRLEIIGEAVSQMPIAFQNDHPEIEWRDIAGMRNKLIHEYFGVDIGTVWEVTQQDLPVLKRQMEDLIED